MKDGVKNKAGADGGLDRREQRRAKVQLELSVSPRKLVETLGGER